MSVQDADLRHGSNQHRLLHLGRRRLLPAGRRHAGHAVPTLLAMLQPGDMLIFEEVIGPLTGQPRGRRSRRTAAPCALTTRYRRLQGQTAHRPAERPLITRSPGRPPTPCRSRCASPRRPTPATAPGDAAVSVARGNIVPADHGTWVAGEDLGPGARLAPPSPGSGPGCSCERRLPRLRPPPPLPALLPGPRAVAADVQRRLRRLPRSATAFLAARHRRRACRTSRVTGDDGSGLVPRSRTCCPATGPAGSSCPRSSTTDRSSCASVTAQYGAGPRRRPELHRQLPDRQRQRRQHRPRHARPRRAAGQLPRRRAPFTAVSQPAAGNRRRSIRRTWTHIRQFAPFAYEQQERCVTEADYGSGGRQVSGVAPRPRHDALDRQLVHRVRLASSRPRP